MTDPNAVRERLRDRIEIEQAINDQSAGARQQLQVMRDALALLDEQEAARQDDECRHLEAKLQEARDEVAKLKRPSHYPQCETCGDDKEFCGNTGSAEVIGEIWKCPRCEIVPELWAEVEALRADARRYRWIVSNLGRNVGLSIKGAYDYEPIHFADDVNAEIDRAIAEQESKQGDLP